MKNSENLKECEPKRKFFLEKYREMIEHAKNLAGYLSKHDVIRIVTHIDADGITSGAIAAKALERAEKEWTIQFEKQLDPSVLKKLHSDFKKQLKEEGDVLFWFADFGSGQINELKGINYIITDHHHPSDFEEGRKIYKSNKEIAEKIKRDIVEYASALSTLQRFQRELNPHFFGVSGSDHLSGAGTTYLVAKALDQRNQDLSPLAVVGAVGDLQDSRHCRLVGLNQFILEEAKKHGLKASYDIRSFGRETRPIFKLLQYTNDPIIPSLSGDKGNCMAFMVFCKEPLAEGLKIEKTSVEELEKETGNRRHWRCWVDLSHESKRTLLSNLVKLLLWNGIEHESALRLLGEVYILEKEAPYSPLRDAKEYATLLNACGRYGNAEIGFRVCLGDRSRYFEKALLLLKGHRRVLVDNMKYVTDVGITEREYIQYFHGEDVIPENVVGIVAGMLLGSGDVNENLPIIGFANSTNGVKVSARTVRKLVRKGINLAKIMKQASKVVGGAGGGHNIAAGAHIPKNKEKEFLKLVEEMVKKQLREKHE